MKKNMYTSCKLGDIYTRMYITFMCVCIYIICIYVFLRDVRGVLRRKGEGTTSISIQLLRLSGNFTSMAEKPSEVLIPHDKTCCRRLRRKIKKKHEEEKHRSEINLRLFAPMTFRSFLL